MNEAQAAEKRIYTALSGAAAVTALVGTRIYPALAPEDASWPHIIFDFQSGEDRIAIGADGRIMARLVFLVKAVAQDDVGSYAAADAVADAIDAALEDDTGTVTISGTTYRVSVVGRESPVRFTEHRQGLIYRHSGGLYRLHVNEN